MNRRKFLKLAGIGAAALALYPAGKAQAGIGFSHGSPALSPEAKGMLIDITKCIGCGMCYMACQQQNGLSGTQKEVLDAETWVAIKSYEVDVNGSKEKRFVRNQCFHCNDPACVSACLVGALIKTPEGPVVYDGGKCMGCRYCMVACPFNVPKYQWDSPFPVIRKCIFCADRVKAGEPTACASACPTGATLFGTRAELVAEAQARLKAEPDKYVQHIYGLEEVGGTSFLFLSDVPFEQLGFPMNLGTRALPEYTQMALSKIPAVVVGGALLLGTAYQLTKDRGDK